MRATSDGGPLGRLTQLAGPKLRRHADLDLAVDVGSLQPIASAEGVRRAACPSIIARSRPTPGSLGSRWVRATSQQEKLIRDASFRTIGANEQLVIQATVRPRGRLVP